MEVADLAAGGDLDVNTADKSLMKKLRCLEQLEDKEKSAFFALLDSLIAKRKLKDNLLHFDHWIKITCPSVIRVCRGVRDPTHQPTRNTDTGVGDNLKIAAMVKAQDVNL